MNCFNYCTELCLQEKLAKDQAETQSTALHQLEQERLDRAVAMTLAHERGEDSATVGDVVLPRMAPAASASMPRRPATVSNKMKSISQQ